MINVLKFFEGTNRHVDTCDLSGIINLGLDCLVFTWWISSLPLPIYWLFPWLNLSTTWSLQVKLPSSASPFKRLFIASNLLAITDASYHPLIFLLLCSSLPSVPQFPCEQSSFIKSSLRYFPQNVCSVHHTPLCCLVMYSPLAPSFLQPSHQPNFIFVK